MTDEPINEEWIARHRDVDPPRDLTDRVMAAVEKRAQQKCPARFSDRLKNSPPARWAACLSALLIGCLPFLYVAYEAKLILLQEISL